ncbi:site-specific DNA-methyltransferase [Niastella caeni]|uniref:site-specific DNA-methyltransferase (adenine-specific) n=1 Tax=Niastella caeni TaxID=2569763 RepID=A0A4S8HS14_9BACT|nr:site-specific DNA-methyltransferase [Niastella caeni]THU38318.1 site-specific DNA-methyltransferase [Niastella caeni]
MSIEKLNMQSPDLVNENIEKLAALFPNCVTETAQGKSIDFDLLKQELNHAVVEGNKERYRLEWPGKRESIVAANLPINKTLRPIKEDSVDFDNTENLYIEGDNLEVLKLLQESYLGKINLIYIDPPYNTGKDFIYKDNFTQDSNEYKEESGQKDEYNQRLVANPETAGRYHSDWLNMIYSRIKLSRNLLTDEGIILISIDDNELINLRKICDEIFGELNFIATLIWEKGRKNDSRFFSQGHEYILVYAKDKYNLKQKDIKWREEKPGAREIYEEYLRLRKIYNNDFESIQSELKKFYSNLPNEHPSKKHARYSNVDERGVWRDDNMSLPRGGARYEVIHPITGKPCAIPPGGWRYATLEVMMQKIKDGYVVFRKDHTEPPIRKTYLVRGDEDASKYNESNEEDEDDNDNSGDLGLQVIGTYFYRSGLQATNELQKLFNEQKIFNNPKDHEILARLIDYCTCQNKNAIILDFFSGSASSAQAVMQLNTIGNGKRKYIHVQIPENTGEKAQAYKAGYKNICEIGKERIRRAAKKIKEETGADIDYGFRVYRLDSSNMQDVYYKPQDYQQSALDLFADNVKPDRTADDLLTQVILSWGLPLSLKIEQITVEGKQVFKVAENSLYACFDKGIDEAFAKAIAEDQPLRIVFRDNGFKDDTAKSNVKQLLKQLSPETEMKVI